MQLSFSLLAFPCVLLQYMGQTAYLIHHPDQYINAFWSAVPKAVFWPLLVVGTLAAIVASQVKTRSHPAAGQWVVALALLHFLCTKP